MAAGLKMSTSVGADLAREDPFLGDLAVFEPLAVGFLDLVGWQTHAVNTFGQIAKTSVKDANIP